MLTLKTINNSVAERYSYDDNGNLIYKKTETDEYKYTYTPNNELYETYVNNNLETKYFYNSYGLKDSELLRKEYPVQNDVTESIINYTRQYLEENETHNEEYLNKIGERIEEDNNKLTLGELIFINFLSVPALSYLVCKSFTTHDKTSLYTAIVLFVGELILDMVYTHDSLTTPISYEEDEYVTHSYDLLKTKPVYSPTISEPHHLEDDTLVVYESGKYTYDYTYDNPLILSESYNTTSYKSNYTYYIKQNL